MTQERSKVIKETENPFGDDEEEEAVRAAQEREEQQRQQQQQAGPSRPLPQFGRSPGMIESFSKVDSRSKKKDKSKGKHRKGFNLEAEKDQMKSVIAESSIASTNLVNALQSINREKERISDNRTAVERFEICKQLRRRVLRYVSSSWSRKLTRYPIADCAPDSPRRARTMVRRPTACKRRARPCSDDLRANGSIH